MRAQEVERAKTEIALREEDLKAEGWEQKVAEEAAGRAGRGKVTEHTGMQLKGYSAMHGDTQFTSFEEAITACKQDSEAGGVTKVQDSYTVRAGKELVEDRAGVSSWLRRASSTLWVQASILSADQIRSHRST